ncbi:NACHT domain-containing protein [Actinomadura darangshiensis]|uniref:NACHT domain-containing protein n=1 Tax=Actinomadura darangshiensis TaxID=705336 RepID=A0A4R5AUH8_9ACTN|nr:NACHT domain-containing protein [Actinomadura darangshiensis]TDD74794.1 NACHT domain-containing protein [Actinomadura darangshiensis]
MSDGRPGPPDPTGAAGAADFVGALVRLRRWAGEPPLSRLRALGGEVVTPDGDTVDALPKSTTSHVLRQTGRLPRWDFVKAFVTACLRYGDHPAELIPAELERWRAARGALAEADDPAPAPPEPSPHVAGPDVESPAPARRDPAVELLARRVAREEDRARRGLLGGYSIAPLSFEPLAGSGARQEADPEAADDLRSIGRFFGGLDPRRLLVVGESGAGKTMLAIELVLQLVEPLITGGGPPAGRPLVPVRLNAARWTPGRPFERWLAEQLVDDFGLAGREAARLVEDRLVLPVVDGLDELDPEPAAGQPGRAIGLLNELNRYSDLSGRRPGAVVVTCRADRYAELSQARAGLRDAALIRLRHLTVEQIGAYLRARWPDGHPCGQDRVAIEKVLSGPPGTAVHLALATPWRLLLAVTAVESGADPAELLRADPGAEAADAAARMAHRMLEAYVPAATELAPRAGHGAGYRPESVRTWLVHLADQLRRQAAWAPGRDRPPGLTAIDIVPHLLWPIGGGRLVRALHGLCCAVFAAVAMLAFWAGSAVDGPGDLRDGLDAQEGLTLALMAGWVAIATGLALSPWPAAAGGRADVPRRRRLAGGLLGAAAGCAAGVLGGLAGLALTGGEVFGPGFAAAAGAAGGLAFGAVIGLTAAGRRGAGRMTVSEAVRAEPVTLLGFGLCGALTGLPPLRLAGAGPMPLTLGVVGAFALAVALGVVFRIATGGWSMDAELAHPREALRRNPLIGVAFGLTGGVAAFLVFLMNRGVPGALACALVGGVAFGLAFGATAWSRAMIGLAVAVSRGLLPLRLWTFLDWACEARLLRVSGATYQFRHRELQDFLTPPENGTGDARDTAGHA